MPEDSEPSRVRCAEPDPPWIASSIGVGDRPAGTPASRRAARPRRAPPRTSGTPGDGQRVGGQHRHRDRRRAAERHQRPLVLEVDEHVGRGAAAAPGGPRPSRARPAARASRCRPSRRARRRRAAAPRQRRAAASRRRGSSDPSARTVAGIQPRVVVTSRSRCQAGQLVGAEHGPQRRGDRRERRCGASARGDTMAAVIAGPPAARSSVTSPAPFRSEPRRPTVATLRLA